MARPRMRRNVPLEVASVNLLLGRDATVHVRSATADDIEPADLARAATVMCVEWAVRATLSDSGWSRDQVDRYLTLICASRSAAEYNTRINSDTIVLGAPPLGTVGDNVHGTLTRNPDGRFLTRWRMPRTCQEPGDASRVLAVLWTLAEEAGNGAVVQHALYALRGGFGGTGQFTPSSSSTLSTSLINFGVEMAEADQRAEASRARIRAL